MDFGTTLQFMTNKYLIDVNGSSLMIINIRNIIDMSLNIQILLVSNSINNS